MAFPVERFVVFILFCGVMFANGDEVVFDANYYVSWGGHHALLEDGGRQMQIYLDSTSGAGFNSKQAFGSGWFNMKIKVPVRDCAGVVVAFYLRSQGNNNQDEIDFEFLGNRPNKSITLQTNIITNGYNKREQRSLFWFDPTADFHDYKILWNHHQVVFYIDDIPIRVFRNNKKIGVSYLTRPMEIVASIWDGSDWATDGGQTKADYSHQPFRAYFRKFDIQACPVVDRSKTDVRECYATRYLWNHRSLRQLNATEQAAYERVRREYMNYDYCANPGRFPEGLPKECTAIGSSNQHNGAT